MALTFHAVRSIPKAAKASVSLVTTDAVDDGTAGAPKAQLEAAGFEGKVGQTHSWPDGGRVRALVGVGSAEKLTTDGIRRAAASIARSFGRHARIGVALPPSELDATAARQALAEGIRLGSYKFLTYKSEGKPTKLARVDVAGGSGARNQKIIA